MCGVTSSCAWRGTRGSGCVAAAMASGFSRKAVADRQSMDRLTQPSGFKPEATVMEGVAIAAS